MKKYAVIFVFLLQAAALAHARGRIDTSTIENGLRLNAQIKDSPLAMLIFAVFGIGGFILAGYALYSSIQGMWTKTPEPATDSANGQDEKPPAHRHDHNHPGPSL